MTSLIRTGEGEGGGVKTSTRVNPKEIQLRMPHKPGFVVEEDGSNLPSLGKVIHDDKTGSPVSSCPLMRQWVLVSRRCATPDHGWECPVASESISVALILE